MSNVVAEPKIEIEIKPSLYAALVKSTPPHFRRHLATAFSFWEWDTPAYRRMVGKLGIGVLPRRDSLASRETVIGLTPIPVPKEFAETLIGDKGKSEMCNFEFYGLPGNMTIAEWLSGKLAPVLRDKFQWEPESLPRLTDDSTADLIQRILTDKEFRNQYNMQQLNRHNTHIVGLHVITSSYLPDHALLFVEDSPLKQGNDPSRREFVMEIHKHPNFKDYSLGGEIAEAVRTGYIPDPKVQTTDTDVAKYQGCVKFALNDSEFRAQSQAKSIFSLHDDLIHTVDLERQKMDLDPFTPVKAIRIGKEVRDRWRNQLMSIGDKLIEVHGYSKQIEEIEAGLWKSLKSPAERIHTLIKERKYYNPDNPNDRKSVHDQAKIEYLREKHYAFGLAWEGLHQGEKEQILTAEAAKSLGGGLATLGAIESSQEYLKVNSPIQDRKVPMIGSFSAN